MKTAPSSSRNNLAGPGRVLVIDDDTFAGRVFSEILGNAGYEAAVFTGVEEATEYFRVKPGGVVLLDLYLEKEYGIDVLPEFLGIDPDTAVLIVTAHASLQSAVQAIHSGAYDYVLKPAEPDGLVNAVRRAMEKYRLGSENRRLLRELTGQVRQLELIGRISTMIASTLELEPLFDLVIEQTQKLLQAEASSLMIVNEGSDELRIAVALGPKGLELRNRTVKIGQGVAGWVAKEKAPLFVPDVRQDGRFDPSFDKCTGFWTRSILAAPLLVRGRVVGVIEVINRKDGEAFRESDLKLLLSFAPHIAVAVDNAKITEELRRSREELEIRVEERTRELTRALHELEQSHRKLQQAQAQLIQSEKLAAIGQLAAGVAHEINNPIAYIHANLHSLEEYFGDLVELLRRQRILISARSDGGQEQELTNNYEELNRFEKEKAIDELTADLGTLLNETKQGALRVADIVRNLKSFSRAESGGPEPVDVNRCLEETLMVINNELKYKAEVIREFGAISPIMGRSGELNQVFLNLLVNAAQAIEKQGRIKVRTFTLGGLVGIEISDTGKGIPPEVLPRIFDPFFTTKSPGEGTGLGLSVAYGIVENHNGQIRVDSVPGRGTTFSVFLPALDGKDRKTQREKENIPG